MFRGNVSAMVAVTKINTFCWVSGYCRHKIVIVVSNVIRNLPAVVLFPRRDRNVLSNNYWPQKRHGPRYRDRATEWLLLTPSAPLHAPAPLASPISHEFCSLGGWRAEGPLCAGSDRSWCVRQSSARWKVLSQKSVFHSPHLGRAKPRTRYDFTWVNGRNFLERTRRALARARRWLAICEERSELIFLLLDRVREMLGSPAWMPETPRESRKSDDDVRTAARRCRLPTTTFLDGDGGHGCSARPTLRRAHARHP